VRVAKQVGYLLVHAINRHENKGEQNVEVRVPLTSWTRYSPPATTSSIWFGADSRAGSQRDTELVSVKDRNNTVHVWLDSKSSGA